MTSSRFSKERGRWQGFPAVCDAVEAKVTYAFHETFGYLTACPTNVGTGIRVSVMMHLPALVQTREVQKVFQSLQKINVLGTVVRPGKISVGSLSRKVRTSVRIWSTATTSRSSWLGS